MLISPDAQFEALLGYLKEARGFDFTGYKRSSLMRRVTRRMTQVGLDDYAEYQDFLQVHPDEFDALFNAILINVTGFFRDAEVWDHLRMEVLQPLVAAKPSPAPIRIWSAGCASGEEAYTLAIILAEILGPDAFRERVKIYATDVDEESLGQARQATYGEADLRDLPSGLQDRYFESVGDRYVFRKDLRRSVIFGRNDLVQDAPISRIDLLVCRNTLMYFNAETQSRILSRFHFSLVDDGVLFLGKAEMLLGKGSLFLPVDLKRRVFRKVSRATQSHGSVPAEAAALRSQDLLGLDQLRNEAFLSSPVAQVVVTAGGLVALSNRQAEALFRVSSRDVGRPFRDLDVSYRPIELRKYIEQAQVDRRVVTIGDIEYMRANAETVYLDVQINPLVDANFGLLGVALVFHDVTGARNMREELENTNHELETAYEELRSTNEELETTNEELQSTVEELETTNEELQSANEELETMNAELQAINDEVQRTNEQLRESTDGLDRVNAFLESILTSLSAGVTVVNRDLQAQVWNRRAEDLWGLRREEVVGQHFLNLDFGLPTERLLPLIRQAIHGHPTDDAAALQEITLSAVNRRGRPITVRVVCTPLAGRGDEPAGAIIVMEQQDAPTPTAGAAQT